MVEQIPKHFFEEEYPNFKPFLGKRVLLLVGADRSAPHTQDIADALIRAGVEVDVLIEPGAEAIVGPEAFRQVGCKEVLVAKEASKSFPFFNVTPDLILGAASSAETFKEFENKFGTSGFNTTEFTDVNLMRSAEAVVGIVKGRLGKLSGPLVGRKIVVSAGGNRESIDAVRWLSNRSSGKQGHAVAEAARDLGAEVVLISSMLSTVPSGLDGVVGIESHMELKTAVDEQCKNADVYIGAAAVADFTPLHRASGKYDRREQGKFNLELVQTTDIIGGLPSRAGFIKVAFSAETGSEAENLARATKKLQEKDTDLVVLNDVLAPGIGFGASHNRVVLVSKDGQVWSFPSSKAQRSHKYDVAIFLLEKIKERLM